MGVNGFLLHVRCYKSYGKDGVQPCYDKACYRLCRDITERSRNLDNCLDTPLPYAGKVHYPNIPVVETMILIPHK